MITQKEKKVIRNVIKEFACLHLGNFGFIVREKDSDGYLSSFLYKSLNVRLRRAKEWLSG